MGAFTVMDVSGASSDVYDTPRVCSVQQFQPSCTGIGTRDQCAALTVPAAYF